MKIIRSLIRNLRSLPVRWKHYQTARAAVRVLKKQREFLRDARSYCVTAETPHQMRREHLAMIEDTESAIRKLEDVRSTHLRAATRWIA